MFLHFALSAFFVVDLVHKRREVKMEGLSGKHRDDYKDLQKEYEQLLAEDPGHANVDKWHDFMQKTKNVWENSKELDTNNNNNNGASPSTPSAIVGKVEGEEKKSDAEHTHRGVHEADFHKKIRATGDTFFHEFDKIFHKDPKVHKDSTLPKKEQVVVIPFGDHDPAWSWAALTALKYIPAMKYRNKYYIPPKAGKSYTYNLPTPNEPTLRIAVVGDLGTNDKHHVAALQGIKQQNPHLVIHLGDIYVAGTKAECKKFWEVHSKVFPESEGIPLWSIPGNHEYISAGSGYFKELVRKEKLGGGLQEASFFCLESEALRLQILALDTGYNSSNFSLPLSGEQMDYTTYLGEKEKDWAHARLAEASKRGYRTIVMMHHQVVSSFWKNHTESSLLVEQLVEVDHNIVAWMWGHEHRLVVLDSIKVTSTKDKDKKIELKNPHCVGHGACPSEDGYYARLKEDINNHKFIDAYTPALVEEYKGASKTYNNGFVMIECDTASQQLKSRYYQVDRRTHATSEAAPSRILS